MNDRDELRALLDRIPDDRLPLLRASVERLLDPAKAAEPPTAQKKYPARTPVGGIITPQ